MGCLISRCMIQQFTILPFPTVLKYAGVRAAFKKDDKTDKENYRSISILPNLSKVYERLMYDQIKSFRNCNAVFVKVFAQNSA